MYCNLEAWTKFIGIISPGECAVITNKDHECLLVLTLGALKYHLLRSEFMLKTMFGFTNRAPIDPSQRMDGESGISIVWDDEETIKDIVARVLNMMGRLRDVGIVTECARLVILCKSP